MVKVKQKLERIQHVKSADILSNCQSIHLSDGKFVAFSNIAYSTKYGIIHLIKKIK